MRIVESMDAIERLALHDAIANFLEQLDARPFVERRPGAARQTIEAEAVDGFDDAVARRCIPTGLAHR